MAFPVDILTNVDHESLEQAAEEYMSQLPYRKPEYLILPNSKQIEIGLCNVSFVPLYGADTKKKILALFSPDDSITVVGLYLLGKWWGVEEVLKTAEPSRTGLIKVSTLGERIVLYVLNRIVLRNEKSGEEVFFLCHGEHESAKILWKDGVAIGFYSFKPKGSLCKNFVTQCYQLPVMDTVFVRKCHRGKDHGVKILEDFFCSFRNEDTGLKFPLSEAMYKVCEKYLRIYPADKEFLWEVENTGGFFQRTLIAKRLQGLKQKEKDHVVSKLIFEEEDATAPMEIEITKIQETTESTMEIEEETIADIMKEADDIPVTRRSTSSNLKRRGIRENSEERLSKNIIRVEDIEAGVKSPIEVATEGSLDNTFSVNDSETVIMSTTDTVTATVTRISEFRSSQKEMGKYIITATSDGTPVTQLTTSEEIKSKKGSKEEFGMVKEHTVEIQGTIIGSNDESQLQSVVNVEIVKMSTGTEEEQHENLENKDLEEDKSVSETGKGEIRQMLDELEGGNAQSETDETFSRTEVLEEITEQPEIHAKLSEKEQVSWDVEITEKKEREGSEVIEVHGKDLIEENRNDNLSPEKCETIHKNIVLQQSVKIKDQTEMEVLCTEEVLCEQQKLCEAEKEVSEPHQRKTYKGTAFEKAKKNKVGPDDTKQVFSQSKLTQKRTSPETPSRRSKRLRHEPAEMIKMTKSVKTSQQRTKHHSKAVIQEEHTEQPVDKYEHDSSKVIEESSAEHQSGAENEVKECIENELTVETVSTVDNEIRQIEKTLYVVPAVSELVKGAEKSHEEVLQQSSAGPIEVQESKTTFEEHEERVEHSKTKVVIIEFDEVSSKKAGDDHGEMDIVEQGELKDLVSTKHQIAEDTLVEEQDGTLNMDTKPMEELACTTGGYIVATDVSVTQEQENKSEVKTTDLIVQGKEEKTKTEHSKKDQQDSYEEDKQYPKQGEQAKKKKLTDVSSRSTRLRDQPIDPGVTPVRRSTRSKEVIQHKLSQPQTRAKILTEKRIDMDENVTPEESEMTNTNIDKATATSSGSSELLKATETDDKVEVPQITEATEEKIPAVEVENDDATEKATKEIKKMTNEEINLAGETDIEMCSLVHEQDIHAPVSTEISLRHRTIKVTSTPIKKSGRVQKREDEVVVEHQARHTLMSKKKTEIISVTEERHEVMDQCVSKLENTGASLAELEPVEKTEISRDKYEEISATTEEVVNVCTSVSTAETCLEEMSNSNVKETMAVEIKSSEKVVIGVDIDDKEKAIQTVGSPEEEVSLLEADHDEGAEKDDGTQIIGLQKSTVVLVDLSQVSQDREKDGESSDFLIHSKTEEQLKLDETDKNEKELEEDKQQEQQKNNDTEKIPEEEKMEDTVVEKYDLNKLNEEQMPTEDQSKDKKISSLSLEKPVQENLDEAAVTTERSLRRRTIQVHSPPKRKYGHIQKQKAETLGHTTEIVLITEKRADEGDQACAEVDDEDKEPHELNVKATEKGIPEEDVAEKESVEINKMVIKETSVAVTKNMNQEADQMREEATSEQQENHPLEQNEKETVETENLTDLVVSKEQTTISKGTIVQVEEEVSQVECFEPSQSDQEGITRRSLRLSTKSVKSTRKTRSSACLHKAESEPVKKVDKNSDEYEKSSAATEETVNVCESVITVETNLESLNELANTNVEETPAVEPETSKLLLGAEIDGIEEKPQTVEVVPFLEAEADDLDEKDDRTSVIQLQNATVVLVDLNKLSQNTERESDSLEFPTLSQTEENIEMEEPNSEHELCNVTPEEKEQQELHIEKDTKETHEQDKMEKENRDEEKNKPNKQDVTFVRQKLTENLIEQIDVIETETIEGYSAVTSGETQEVTQMADKTNIIKETEQDQDVALKEKQADSKAEMSSIAHGASEIVQEILEEETPFSTERSLRRRTIIVQSPPRKKSRLVQKQVAEAFEDKNGKLTVTGTVVEEMPQKLTVETTDKEIPLAEEEPKDCVAEKVAKKINQVENNVTYTNKEILETEEDNLVQQDINEKQTTDAEESLEIDPVVSKGQPYNVEGTTIQVEEEVSQVECIKPNQSGYEGITRRSLRLNVKSVKTTQKTRSSARLHKAESEPVKEVYMNRDEYEESSATTDKTVNVCVPVITVETNLESFDELANTNVEETPAVEPETSEPQLDEEIDGKEEGTQTVEVVPLEKAELDGLVEKDDRTSVIQLQKATVVLVDLNKLSQNTDGESDTPEISMHSHTEENSELDKPIYSEHQLCNVTPEEKEQELKNEKETKKTPEHDKMEKENTDKPEEQNDAKETETIEGYSAVTSGETQEVTQMADKTNIIKETKQDQDVALKGNQADRKAEMSSIAHGASEIVQEILEEETPFSTERSLRRRTIIVQSPPRKKSRLVQKQVAEAFEDKNGKLTVTGKVVEEINKEMTKIDGKEEMPQTSTVEITDEEIPLAEEEPKDCVAEKVALEINQVKNKLTYTNEETIEMEEANLVQQDNDPLVINKKETTETEESLEMYPVVSKGQPYIVEGTTIQEEEAVSQVESNESNQSGQEGITRRSLRLITKSVKTTQKTRSSARLHKAESEPVKDVDMNRDEYEESSARTEEAVNVCKPAITVETNLESFDDLSNKNVEETPAVELETSELLLGVDGNEEEPQTVEMVPLEEAKSDDLVEKDDRTSVIQLQNATVVLVDLNKLSQNTDEENDTPEISTHSQTEENIELKEPIYSDHGLGKLTAEEEENQVLQMGGNIEKTPELKEMQEEVTDKKQNKYNKQDEIFEGQNLTEDLEEQNDVIEKQHLEATAIADKSNIIQDVDLKEKQTEGEAEMSSLLQESAVSVQEILVQDEAPINIERRLRQRTITIQSTPRKKTRDVEKQEASGDKVGKVQITRKAAKEMHKEIAKVDGNEETIKQSTVEATEKISFIEAEPDKCVTENVAEEINKVENKETNLVVAKDTDEEAPDMKTAANLEQQETHPLAINEEETTETEKPMEINKDPVVNKVQTYILKETPIHLVEEEVPHVESIESNQNDHEKIKRRSLRLSAKSVPLKKKTRKSARLHNAELDLAKEADISRDEFEETSTATRKISLNKKVSTVNINVEETQAVEHETSELLIGVKTYDEAPQTAEEVLLEDIGSDEGAKKDDDTPVTQLQKATVVLVDLNKQSQNTEEESDTSGAPIHSQTEENMELDSPVYSEQQLCNKRTEEEQQELQKEKDTEKAPEKDKVEEECTDEEHNETGKQDITSEGQKPTEDLERQINVQRTIVEEIIDEHVQEAVKSGEHSEATTMAADTNIQETENYQNIALEDKHADSNVEISYLAHEVAEAVQETLEEEVPVSTERSLRRRTIQIQSPLKRKSRRLQKQEAKAFEDKTTKVPITGKAVDEHQEATKIDDRKQTLQKSTVEATLEEILPVETEPEECVAEKVENMENKEIHSENEEAHKMEREEAILEQQKNEDMVENIIETDEVSMVTKEQIYIVEETTVHAELELTKEADTSRNEDDSLITIETVRSKTVETNAELLNVYGDMVSVSGNVETNSDEQGIDSSNDGGKVDESLHNISTDKEDVDIEGSTKTTENTVEETQKDLDEGVQEEQKPGENTDQEQEKNNQDKTENEMITYQEAVSQEDNVWETNPGANFRATAVEAKVALENTDQETTLITRRSLRSRTVTVQSTPGRTPKRLHRQKVEPEKETKSDTCGNENDSALPQLADDLSITVESITEFEDTKDQEDIIQLNTEDMVAEIETREDTVEEGKEIQEKNELEKTHNDNLEREDVQVSKEQDEVSDVLDKEKQLKEIQNESAAGVQGCSYDTEETRITLRKRTIVEEAAPRKSKRSRKEVHSEDIEHIKEAVMGQSESVEDNVELRSDESTVIFKASNSQEEILQKILRNTEESNRQIETTDETLETVISEQCLEAEEQQLESSANEGFTLELEVEETSDLEENKVDEENSMSIEPPKVVSTSAEKLEGEENTSDNDEKGLSIEKHVCQSTKAAVSARRKSMRLQMHESKKKTNESDSEESEVRFQRKRKAITDSTPARRSKRHARGKNI